jgi:hypothetical protein
MTVHSFLEGKSIASIAKERDFTEGTILQHLEKAVAHGEHIPKKLFAGMIKPPLLKKIIAGLEHSEKGGEGEGLLVKLAATKTYLESKKTECTFDEIRLARLIRML